MVTNIPLCRFSKFLCGVTLLLLFLGALVKSTESGLSVPDWPTTYGRFMFAFPLDQMVGGIKYEHVHRMLASIVGLLTLTLCIWLWNSKQALWLKRLGLVAFVVVVGQGILGGITVKFFLPVWLSMMHGVLAQTFFLLVIMIAYGLSLEYQHRRHLKDAPDRQWVQGVAILVGMIYIQLILGNWMRHTQSGLAVPDFPTMGGTFIPTMDQSMLDRINAWRFENNLDAVSMPQVYIHLLHRLWAFFIFLALLYVNYLAYQKYLERPLIVGALFWLNLALVMQIMLGISTVLSRKGIIITTLHVTVGAMVLGLSFLLLLRSLPCSWAGCMSVLWIKK